MHISIVYCMCYMYNVNCSNIIDNNIIVKLSESLRAINFVHNMNAVPLTIKTVVTCCTRHSSALFHPYTETVVTCCTRHSSALFHPYTETVVTCCTRHSSALFHPYTETVVTCMLHTTQLSTIPSLYGDSRHLLHTTQLSTITSLYGGQGKPLHDDETWKTRDPPVLAELPGIES